jgi:DNA-binding HxlR family transcriptional regulator
VRSYGQYCPVARAAEVLGDRWTLLVVRDLVEGAHRFGELADGLPSMSRTLLSQRLRSLEREGIVERRRTENGHHEYWLTEVGEDLKPALLALGEWAARNYSRDPVRRELDARLLLTWILRELRRDELPGGRFLVRFDFRAPRASTIWLLCEDHEPSICTADPGFESDLVVTTDLAALNRLFAGRIALSVALRSGAIALEGSRSAVRGFSRWFGESPFAGTTRGLVAKSA